MANASWFNSLPSDLQKIVLEVGEEIGTQSTLKILQTGEETLVQFQERGGVVNNLNGDKLDAFNKLMSEKVQPKIADKIDSVVLEEAKKF